MMMTADDCRRPACRAKCGRSAFKLRRPFRVGLVVVSVFKIKYAFFRLQINVRILWEYTADIRLAVCIHNIVSSVQCGYDPDVSECVCVNVAYMWLCDN